MKKLLFLFALVFSFAFANEATAQSSSTEDFTFEISDETSREDLAEMKQNIATYGVSMDYNPSFDQNRNLIGIKVKVTFNEDTGYQYQMNPLQNGQVLTIERLTEENGNKIYFVGQK